jgi:hypothetical protein
MDSPFTQRGTLSGATESERIGGFVFGFAVNIAANGDLLTVTIPVHPFLLIIFCFIPFSILIAVFRMTRTPKGRITALLLMLMDVVLLGLIFTPAKVILDAESGTAIVSDVFMFISHRQVVPLNSLEGATVRTADVASALVIIYSNGQREQLTPFSQTSGQDQAADAINAFLAAHRGASDRSQTN